MLTEYDPFNDADIGLAVARAIELCSQTPAPSLETAVEQAVHECICACALDVEDEIEHGRSGIHDALAVEVMQRVQRRLSPTDAEEPEDCVDEASEEAFPASDPPSWIWERR